MVTLKYRLMHANSDDRFFVEPSGLLMHPSGDSTSGVRRNLLIAINRICATHRSSSFIPMWKASMM